MLFLNEKCLGHFILGKPYYKFIQKQMGPDFYCRKIKLQKSYQKQIEKRRGRKRKKNGKERKTQGPMNMQHFPSLKPHGRKTEPPVNNIQIM